MLNLSPQGQSAQMVAVVKIQGDMVRRRFKKISVLNNRIAQFRVGYLTNFSQQGIECCVKDPFIVLPPNVAGLIINGERDRFQ